jgi:hypothetical protein
LGTGNVGGDLLPGTFMDVGFLEYGASTRIPESDTAPPWRVTTRAFTQGQRENPSRAEAIVSITNVDNLNPVGLAGSGLDNHALVSIQVSNQTLPTDFYFTRVEHETDVTDPLQRVYIDDVDFAVSELYEITDFSWVNGRGDGGGTGSYTFAPGESLNWEPKTSGDLISSADLSEGDTLHFYPKNEDPDSFNLSNGRGTMVFDAWIEDNGGTLEARVRATNVTGWQLFEDLDPLHGATGTISFVGATIPPGGNTTVNVPVTGANLNDAVAWSFEPPNAGFSAPYTARVAVGVSALNNVQIVISNPPGAPGNVDWPAGDFYVAALRDADIVNNWSITVPELDYYVRVIKNKIDVSAATQNLVQKVNTHPDLSTVVKAYKLSESEAVFQAIAPGEDGNDLRVTALDIYKGVRGLNDIHVRAPSGTRNERLMTILFSGGEDQSVNGGDGTTQLRLTGMTERLPLGILLQDADFIGENPLGDTASAMKTTPAGPRSLQTVLPLTTGGEEFTRYLGGPGDLLAMADGTVLEYTPFNESPPPGSATGAKTLRIYRGGGSAFLLSGLNPGGPVDWVSETFSAPLRPVLKGGALVCRAMLVRNYYEEAFDTPFTVSQGDEIQMAVITHGVLGDQDTPMTGIELSGIISPSGYGEGYAAADRYRIEGRPMFKGMSRVTPDPEDVVLAPVPDSEG